MSYKILAINPGSTSTKISVYENEQELFVTTLDHPAEEVAKYATVAEQFGMRKDYVLAFLKEKGLDVNELAAVVGRGGMLPPVKSGAYEVNEAMVKRLRYNPVLEHASNLGALIAFEIAQSIGKRAFIYDSVKVDELLDVARVTGVPELPRTSVTHTLNSRAMAMKCAKSKGKTYQDMNFIVVHMGGGVSVNAHQKGRLVDVIPDNEGPMSPERAGRIGTAGLVDLCYSGKYDKRGMHKKLRGEGGLKAYLGTVDVREVIKMIEGGNEQAKLLLEAMCYQIAKGVGEMATVLCGQVDAIIFTGGIAYSKLVCELVKERISWIAPVEILAGENEMESLTLGTLRVLRGEESAHEYVDAEV
nr:butyrate kinase [uncultured Holophaga sp.]